MGLYMGYGMWSKACVRVCVLGGGGRGEGMERVKRGVLMKITGRKK